MTSTLNYSSPAERWFDALPIGNGRLGGMVYSGIATERIQLAESTAWSGSPSETDISPTARENVPIIQDLLFSGEHAEAQRLADAHLLGNKTSFGTNLPLPELLLEFAGPDGGEDYSRRLDLTTAVVHTEFRSSGTRFTREVFASHPDRVIVVRLEADAEASISCALLFGEAIFPISVAAADGTLVLRGRAVETLHSDGTQGVDMEIRVSVRATGGTITEDGARLSVAAATAVTIIVAIGTSWDAQVPSEQVETILRGVEGIPYRDLLERHIDDYHRLESRVALDLGASEPALYSLPTNERRRRYERGGDDPELETLFFRFGRYLTIAGSREDSPLPLALQGLWNDGLASSASWTNDFHLDMNTQQNYWAAEVTNLAECHEPLVSLVERLSVTGQTTAKEMYDANGWVAHTVTNAWGYSAPGTGPGWGTHVTAGAWIALHLWDHYDFSRDVTYLRDRAYPVLRGAALFFLDYLSIDPGSGWLVTGPSDSPENWYLSPEGDTCATSMGNTCDRVFVEAILRVCEEATRVLGVDSDLSARLFEARRLLPPFQIGKRGQLQEWLHDFDEAVPSHRHTSHLCALYPERQIHPRTTPELAKAAEVTIELRQSAPGWEQTEWVEANMVNFFARLGNGDKALSHLRGLIAQTAEANLMTYSAGGVAGAAQNIYSFDGNAGATAGVAEMLLQSIDGEIEMLPALPTAWRSGSVSGLRARGGITVDLSWENGRLAGATLVADRDARSHVRHGEHLTEMVLAAGEAVHYRPGE